MKIRGSRAGATSRAPRARAPVGTLDNALRKALTNDYPELEHITLEDFCVRVLDETYGRGAVVRAC